MAGELKGISTHVLDLWLGKPATGVGVEIHSRTAGVWTDLGLAVTDEDGRCRDLLGGAPLQAGDYRLVFRTEAYFEAQRIASLYPEVVISFSVRDPRRHYHIPLLLAPNGYTTYRGT